MRSPIDFASAVELAAAANDAPPFTISVTSIPFDDTGVEIPDAGVDGDGKHG